MADVSKAVFLSYASQDAEAVKRICAALRQAGVEVWFDQNELVGGDAWDAKIRGQIASCALFVPVISANTQARLEGYFRIEWKIAAQRTHAMADEKAFLLPIVIDATHDGEAKVPAEFRAVQWTRLRPAGRDYGEQARPGTADADRAVPADASIAAFCGRVKALLDGGEGAGTRASSVELAPRRPGPAAVPGETHSATRRWILPTAIGAAIVLALVIAQPWREGLQPRAANTSVVPASASSPSVAPAPASAPASEARRLVAKARALLNQLDQTREDFKIAEDYLKQALAKDGSDAEVWAAYAQLHSRYRARGWDLSEQRREDARTATQRALRLDPRSFEARFAQTGIIAGGPRDFAEREALLRELLRERPDDQRVLRAIGSMLRNDPERRSEGDEFYDRSARLPGGDPLALYNKALSLWFVGRAAEAEAALQAALQQKPFVSARLMEVFFALSLRGDRDEAKRLLDRLPAAELLEDRGLFFAYLVHRYRGEAEAALTCVRAVARDWIDDNWFRGPRARLAGDALAQAGRPDAAAVEWRAALKVVDARLASNPNEQIALASRLVLLAQLGETAEAGKLLPTMRQMVRADDPTTLAPTWLTRATLMLGDKPEALRQMAAVLKSNRHTIYYTAADLRHDPLWAEFRSEPEFAGLVAEAERIERAGAAEQGARK